MNGNNSLPSERLAVLGVVAPINKAVGSSSTGWIHAKDFAQFLAIVSLGVLANTATFAAKLEQATSSGGAGAKDITGKAITNISGNGGDGKQALINLHNDELDTNNDFVYFRMTITVTDSASPDVGGLISGTVFGVDPHNAPPTQATTVAEVVS